MIFSCEHVTAFQKILLFFFKEVTFLSQHRTLLFSASKTPEGNEYEYIKEVVDNSTKLKVRLLNPIVLQLRQNQVVLAYPFKYLSGINGKVTEIVVKAENYKNFTGCDDTSPINPTCGIQHLRGEPIPFSQGFCCYCPDKPTNINQKRGGQSCNRDVEKKMKGSAHCLKFNDIWFTVNSLGDPIILHDLFLQVFNERYLVNGSVKWVSLTHEEVFELGTNNPSKYDNNKTFVAEMFTGVPKAGTTSIKSAQQRLLIPQPMPGVEVEKLPAVLKNGATDYLIIDKSRIQASGTKCDAAGISYEGFSKQPNRCFKPKDTCLENQPLDFWEKDKGTQGRKRGSYLLRNYGNPSKEPIIVDNITKNHFLALDYDMEQRTALTIEIKADNIVFLSLGRFLQILSVVSAFSAKDIIFLVTVSNKDLLQSTFTVRSTKCQYNVPNSKNITGTIMPQLLKEFTLSTKQGGIQLTDTFTCAVQVTSKNYGLVAERVVKVKPKNRCICSMHCECICTGESLVCEALSNEDFHKAGFRGSVPQPSLKKDNKLWSRRHPELAFLAFIFFLILLGFAKAIIGVMGHKKIGYFGLESRIFGSRNLSGRKPILSEKIIFALNVFFCFTWPAIKLIDRLRSKAQNYEPESSLDRSSPDSFSSSYREGPSKYY